MSREIKFRFWSGTKMFYDIPNVMLCLQQQMAVWQGADPLRSFSTIAYDHEKEHGANFMQYTGLKDKNRKEVYEGDICRNDVRTFGMNKDYDHLYEVIWKEGQFGMTGSTKWLKQAPCFDFVRISGEWATGFGQDQIEVIGNIHENPELLK